jgi:ribonuclease HII
VIIAGVDEVGRGCLAGPVTAAAVILKNHIPGLNDSKQISSSKREVLSRIIIEESIFSFANISNYKKYSSSYIACHARSYNRFTHYSRFGLC